MTDSAAAECISLPIPKFFADKMLTIDAICATKALGALKNSPHLFLRPDLDMKPPEIRLTAKKLNTIALIAAKPPTHPLYHVYQPAQDPSPQAHRGPVHSFFQSETSNTLSQFTDIQHPNPTINLPETPNLWTLIFPKNNRATNSIQDLKTSTAHTMMYLDSSRVKGKKTAAAAWYKNTKHFYTFQLGKEIEYGIFKAKFKGPALALEPAIH